jgi:large subunit ribosomal protein L15
MVDKKKKATGRNHKPTGGKPSGKKPSPAAAKNVAAQVKGKVSASAAAKAAKVEKRQRVEKAAKAPAANASASVRAKAPVDNRPKATGVHDLAPAPGATHSRKRVGRGPGSGHAKTAGRGSKGQKSRSGYSSQRGFEGGQMPLHRRLPKRGFTNIFRVEYDIVNLSDLDRFDAGQKVTPESLISMRLARKSRPVKILGDGQIQKALNVSAHKFSASAQAKIEAAGGRCEVIPR